MIIYNVTIKVEHSVAKNWLKWMKKEHIPDVLRTGCFTGARILRLLEADVSDGYTYIIQYEAENKSKYNRYINKFSSAMRKKSLEKWGDKFVAYRTVMQVVK